MSELPQRLAAAARTEEQPKVKAELRAEPGPDKSAEALADADNQDHSGLVWRSLRVSRGRFVAMVVGLVIVSGIPLWLPSLVLGNVITGVA